MSFDIGWNKHSSGHKCDSLSGHVFIIVVYARCTIAFDVFSKTCSICNARNKKNKAEGEVIVINNQSNESESKIKSEIGNVPIEDAAVSPDGSSSNYDNSAAVCLNDNSATIYIIHHSDSNLKSTADG